jgi:PST family polysaccharide transporter/lipopolysaccharide exporter
MTDRFPFPQGELRHRTLRGVLITGGFVVLIDVLVLAQGLIVTRVLGPRNIGLYGIVSAVALSLIGLKRVGIDEAFVAQDEGNQEREFQLAFTLELGLAAIIALLIVVLSPVVALVWRDSQLMTLMISLAYLPLAFALQAPMWIFLRRMDFARQR